MTYIITQACVDVMDKACIEECPVDCIYEGGRMLYIHPDECVDCGACQPVCPTDAIFYGDDLPAELSEFRETTEEFFVELGMLGGAQTVPPQPDPARIASWPVAALEQLSDAAPGD